MGSDDLTRTAEMLITFLGIMVYSFFSMIGGATLWMNKNPDKVANMLEDTNNEGMDVTKEEFLILLEDIGGSGWYVLIGSLIAIIVGGIAIYLLRGNKNSLIAGISLLISAILSTFLTFLLAWPAAIFYIIAGIMSLVRKPKESLQNNMG